MTSCFYPKPLNCRRYLLFAPEELSGMLHSIALSAQLHKKIAEGLLIHDVSRLSDELGSGT